ncbi:MAG: hypothetical protein AABX11_02320 [Nanoarchaeota archaeon]
MESFDKIMIGLIGFTLGALGILKTIDYVAKLGEPQTIVSTDLNGDGVKDLVIYGNRSWDSRGKIFIGNTNGTYAPWKSYRSNLVNQTREGVEKLEREVESRVKGLEGRQ